MSAQNKDCNPSSSADSTTQIQAVPAPPGEIEVFGTGDGTVDFRNVGWIRAAIVMVKMTFASAVLSLPTSLHTLGAAPGAFFILFWGILNTYMAVILGNFKMAHPSVHTIADGAEIAILQLSGGNKKWSKVARETTEVIFVLTWVLVSGLAILGLSIALNAVTQHATCSVVFGFLSYVLVAAVGSIRKIENIAWVSWVGFFSIVIAVMTVLVATTLRDRPAAAPKTGDFDLGFSFLPATSTTFAGAWAASLIVYSSSSNTSGFLPIISEMRNPRNYFKSLYWCMAWVTGSYMVIGLIMFRYTGQWLSSPALGSAGPTIKIVSYAIAIPGLIAGAMVFVHVAGKSVFVRILRNSRHLTANTWQHWAVWLGSTFGTGLAGWVICEAIPFYGSLISIIGALGFGPLGICLPTILWFGLQDNLEFKPDWRSRLVWVLHLSIFCLGLFVTFGGTYASVVVIVRQYRKGTIGGAFQCADNSNG